MLLVAIAILEEHSFLCPIQSLENQVMMGCDCSGKIMPRDEHAEVRLIGGAVREIVQVEEVPTVLKAC